MSKERFYTSPEQQLDAASVVNQIQILLSQNKVHEAASLERTHFEVIGRNLGLNMQEQMRQEIREKRDEVIARIEKLIANRELEEAAQLATTAFIKQSSEFQLCMRRIERMKIVVSPAEYDWDNDFEFNRVMENYSDQQRNTFANYLMYTELSEEDRAVLATGDFHIRMQLMQRLWATCQASMQLQ